MTIEQAKSELMQIYGMLSPDKQRAIDTLVKIEPCEDAISRQAAIMAMNELHVTDRDVYGMELSKCFDNDRANGKLLSLPPVQPTSGWIPVSERLPENTGKYLVSGKNEMWICEFLDMGVIQGWANNAKNPCVEAWTSLPTPYQAESEEV